MADVSAILLDARELEDALQHSFVAFQNALSRLVDRGRVEGVLAALHDDVFVRLTQEVQGRFPRTAQQYIGSTHAALLSSFADNIPDAILPSDGELVERVKECWSAVVLARPVLFEIATMARARTWDRATVRAKLFSDIGCEVPNTMQELTLLERDILRDQEGILKYYLEVLRGPARVDILARQRELREREAAAVHPPPRSTSDSGAAKTPPEAGLPSTSSQTAQTDGASKVPKILNTALYAETVQGFGEWEVFVTDRAKKDLRKLRKESKEIFPMVMKKIRDVSRGHFSSDNQIRVVDMENGVPIFKARVGGAHRLVYQVDSVEDTATGDAYQALRIFGVYDHAEMHRKVSFWEVLSRDLGRQGQTYRDQCRARSHPRTTGNDVFDPVKFYWPGKDQDLEDNGDVNKPTALDGLDDRDYEAILSMHRRVKLSKGLFNSFLVGNDLEFMYRPSATETEIIEHPSSCYIIGRSGTGKTLSMMYKIVSVERHWWGTSWDTPRPRQLFVTRSRMLSRQVRRTVYQILESFKLADLSQQELVDIWKRRAEPVESSHPLPRKWSDLKDEHFPLVISFDELRELLEAEFAAAGLFKVRTTELEDENLDETSFVSARRFIETYWVHLPHNLVKGLDPVSVFGEIMGVIKGSEGTVNTAHGYLDREAYLKLSERMYPTFASMRDTVYDIFARYLSLKRRGYERDDADRTHSIISLLNVHGLPGMPVEFLFNDEAQDNLIIDMMLLRSLCFNSNGLCWAGDTAQTIALGSAFKFSELTSMMYRVEQSGLKPSHQQSYIQPRTFHLTVNYRSHAGIINCAQTVVDLLLTVWPESIDRLDPDRGWRKGPKPKFVRRSGFKELFQFTSQDGIDVRSEFGSGQCIIVRDDASRNALFSLGTPGGQVMTVYESKGLEFNDVFLWHFFGSSDPSVRDWECVCEVLWGNPLPSHKTTDHYRNVCRELKALYVAITRARNRLWIIEADDSNKADPMLMFWTAKDMVEVTEASIPIDVPEQPDTEGWATQGRLQMDKENFVQAKYAFERAGPGFEREYGIAHAYLAREVAITEKQFWTAAESFEQCAKSSEGMPDHKELIVSAAVCYSRARAFTYSARLYHSVREYTKCTRQYIRGSEMEDARRVVLEHKDDIDESAVKDICQHFLDKPEYRQVEELFRNNREELIEFMERHNLSTQLANYLEHLGRLCEAAEVWLALNNNLEAIRVFFRDDQATAVARGTVILLGEFRRRYTLGLPVDKSSKGFKKLNEHLSTRQRLFTRHPLPQSEENEIRMFSFITSRRTDDLLKLGEELRFNDHRSLALLSFDYALIFLLEEGPLETVLRMAGNLTIFPVIRSFAALVKSLKSHRDEARTSQVFGIDKGASDSYVLRKGTLLYDAATAARGRDGHVVAVTNGLIIKPSPLLRLLRRTLDNRLHSHFSLLSNACKKVDALRPCLSFCLSGDCVETKPPCRWAHSGKGPHHVDQQGIHHRIRILCEVIIVYDILDPNIKLNSIWEARAEWMDLFSHSIQIPFFALGSPLMFNSKLVPRFSEASGVLNNWISEILYSTPTSDSEGSVQMIPSPIRSRAISCAVLLQYMLVKLQDRLQTTSTIAPPLRSWHSYGPSYRNHVQRLWDYVKAKPARAQMPGALLYLQFLLDGGSQLEGLESIITYLAEGLATAFILSNHITNDRTLHNLVLGRGWLGTLRDLWAKSSAMTPYYDEGHLKGFVQLFLPLLRMLCTTPTGPSGLLLPSEDQLSSEISRVVNAWFLVGYSLELPEENRTFIVDTIRRIPERLRPLHLLRTFYSPARAPCLGCCAKLTRKSPVHGWPGWDDLEQAVWHYNGLVTNPDRSTELIHVQKEDRKAGRPMDTPGTVVPIVYKGLNSLPSLLSIRSLPRPPIPFPLEWRLPKHRTVPRRNTDWARSKPVLCFRGQPMV